MSEPTPPVSLAPPTVRPVQEALLALRGMLGLPALLTDPARGPGRHVMVIPGFRTGDEVTVPLRSYLRWQGHHVVGWGLGTNHGGLRVLVPVTLDRVLTFAKDVGEPVYLVGWSLGGVIAREVARRAPHAVAHVVTMGSPVVGGPRYTAAANYYAARGEDLAAIEHEVALRNAQPLPVSVTAVYSELDSVVAWGACVDPNPLNRVRHVRLPVGHAEMGVSASVFREVAQALAAHGR